MSVTRFQASATGRDIPVSPVDPLPVTSASQGALTDAAWDGTGNPSSVIALMKYQCDLLEQIVTNTTP